MVFVITGPTGCGKTSLGEEFAAQASLEIVNADAYQMYREIPIISNQPVSPKVKYHFLSDRSLAEPSNAGKFSREAASYLTEKYLWVGTGLYLGAALYGLDPQNAAPEKTKRTPFQGEPLASYKMLVVERDRAELYELINKRVDSMIERGAIKEIKAIDKMLEDGKIQKSNPILKAIGVRQVLQFFSGEISESKAVEIWKRDTRHLAKRQWTWLRKFCAPSKNIHWLNLSSTGKPQEKISQLFTLGFFFLFFFP